MAREICEVKSRNIVSSSTGFCYSDVTSGNSHLVNQIHGGCFASNPDMFNLTAGMEVIGFSKTPAESTTELYQHELTKSAEFTTGNLMVGTESTHWQDNNNRLLLVDSSSSSSSSFRFVFERPTQGLSLFLSSTKQSFELRDGFFGSKAASLHHEGQFQLGCSKYLSPTRELLNEFCSLRTTQIDASKQNQTHKTKKWYDDDDDHNNGASSSRNQSLHSLDFMELQRRKTKLLSMLEEVDRRYRHYCVQMKAVVSSFEAVAGNGAASVYSALASKAMSRHFKCLRDGIVGQIEATRMAMGEKGPVAPGTTRGETPRLKIIDQSLRHQRCFQQMNAMENHPWRPQRGLPERSVSVLRAWLFEHFLHPYPNDVDKHILARQTGLSRSQVSNWFINARVRLWKPMVEEMYLEETKEHENNMAYSDGATDDGDDNVRGQSLHNPNILVADRKPTVDQLVRVDSECLSSIISNPDRNDAKSARILQNFGTYGAMELDFSSYSHHRHTSGGGASYGSDYNASNQTCFNVVGGGGVSLTLGLQQHGGTGVNLAFAPGSQSSLFYPRGDHIEDCQPVQYSVLDGEGQHLPYRNLMGAQLLHDFAG